jgi:hypothetical protein
VYAAYKVVTGCISIYNLTSPLRPSTNQNKSDPSSGLLGPRAITSSLNLLMYDYTFLSEHYTSSDNYLRALATSLTLQNAAYNSATKSLKERVLLRLGRY